MKGDAGPDVVVAPPPVRRSRRTAPLLAVAVAIAAAVAGWYFSAPAVRLAAPVRGPAVDAVYATGIVEPVTWAKVTPTVSGRIVEMCDCEGQPVKRGDLLVRLDDAEERARLAELQARARFLQSDADRYRALVDRRTVSLQTYQQVASRLEEVRAAIAAEQERLNDYTIRSPSDGVVLRKDGYVGEVVAPGEVIFWVGQPRPLWLVADVDEEDIPRVQPGQRALIKADAFPDRVLEGTVRLITPKGDPVNKSYRVRIDLPDTTPLLIGMTTEVNIVVRTVESTVLIPAEAVVGRQVFVVDGSRVRLRPVTIGVAGETMIEIKDGIALDEKVVLAPSAKLKDGDRVRIRAGDDGEPSR